MKDTRITEYEFVSTLIKALNLDEDNEDSMQIALNHKLVEDYDISHKDEYIERRHAARIIHSTLINYLHEEDLVDWSVAENLKDLYECHVCVNNIAQVYAKGIMDTQFNGIFDVKGNVTYEECTIFFLRMMNSGLRKIPGGGKARIFQVIEASEALETLHKDKHSKLVDVRFKEDFDVWHLENSINIPLAQINKNPYIVDENRDNCIMLFCKRGYQSRLAAGLLLNAGYTNVYVVNGVDIEIK